MLPIAMIGRMSTRLARRSRFLAERLWLVAALELAWIARRHWRRLEPDERRRLIELARNSKGRPSKLDAGERREAAELLEKLDYAQFGGTVAGTLLPFRPLSRLVEFALGRPTRSRRRNPGAAET
jgi:hypothetical protein